MRRLGVLIGAVLCVAGPAQLASQASRPLELGDRVRVLAPSLGSDVREGVLVRVSAGQMQFKESKGGATQILPTRELMRLDVWGPGSGTQAGKGAAIGAVTGGVLAGVIGYAATRCPGLCSMGEYGAGLGAILAVPGGGVGAIIGGLLGRSARSVGWQPVDLPLRLTVAPAFDLHIRLSGSLDF